MANIGLHRIRRQLDDAITYSDFSLAEQLAEEGLNEAEKKEWLGEILYFKAQREILQENHFEALKFLDSAIKYNPKDGAAYNDRALCMIELGMMEEVFDYFDKGIEVEPDYATIYHNKGWLLSTIERHDEALEYFEKALELEEDRSVTYENMAYAFLKLKRKKEALEAYEKALKYLKPIYADIREQIVAEIERLRKDIR